ncbi:MAG: hypothetical protein ACRCTA_07420, partial [Bacilli bacterium]
MGKSRYLYYIIVVLVVFAIVNFLITSFNQAQASYNQLINLGFNQIPLVGPFLLTYVKANNIIDFQYIFLSYIRPILVVEYLYLFLTPILILIINSLLRRKALKAQRVWLIMGAICLNMAFILNFEKPYSISKYMFTSSYQTLQSIIYVLFLLQIVILGWQAIQLAKEYPLVQASQRKIRVIKYTLITIFLLLAIGLSWTKSLIYQAQRELHFEYVINIE